MTRTRSQLFLCAFAAQAGFLTLSPILPDIAAEFGTSSATVGQLRTLSGLIGGLVALYLLFAENGPGLVTILRGSLLALAGGSVVSAAAPDMAVLAAGQTAIGAGSAGLLTGGIAAAARWPAPEEQRSVLTWAIVGQPAAWVIGMPLIGVVADVSWRLTWLALPVAGAVLALTSLRNRTADTAETALRQQQTPTPVAGWAAGELLASAAWGGTLVFAGALLRESYGISAGTTGILLGLGAATYFAGAFLAKRSSDWRAPLVSVTLLLAVGLAVFGSVRPGLGFSAAIFGLLVMIAGARTTLASSFVLEIPPEDRLRASGARAAAMQFGYLAGAFVAGAAVAAGGFGAMGVALGVLLGAASTPHAVSLLRARHVHALRGLYAMWGSGQFGPRFLPRFDLGWSPEFPDRPPMAEWLGEWRDWRIEPTGWIHRGGHLVVLVRFRGTGRASGARVDAQGAHLWAFREGRAARLEIYSDPALALAAASPGSLDTIMSRLARVPLSCVDRWRATFSTPSIAKSSSSTAAWARPSSSST
jgi:predicted MFS family arabinose efflux permease